MLHPRTAAARGLLSGLLGVFLASCSAEEPTAPAPPDDLAPSTAPLPAAAEALRAAFPSHAAQLLDRPRGFHAGGDGFAAADSSSPGTPSSAARVVVRLPRRAQDAIVMQAGDLTISVRELGAGGEGLLAGAAVIYPRETGSSVWAATPEGSEEWIHLYASDASTERSERVAGTWSIDGASVQKTSEGAQLLDDAGIPRIRISAPVAYARSGRAVPVRLEVAGAQITALVQAGGEEVLVDPLWSSTASMAHARYHHTATLLQNGKVLVVGGTSPVNYSPELYDPSTKTWSPTASTLILRYQHAATLLPNGKVLITGGMDSDSMVSAEIYDPGSDTWTLTKPPAGGHGDHTATLLPGGKVLLYGGWALPPAKVPTEIYDPATNSWSTLGLEDRVEHTATMLQNGKVLFVGGIPSSMFGATSGNQLYDPAGNTWTVVPPSIDFRFNHAASLLPSGQVLVSGGTTSGSPATSELYDPTTNTWSSAGLMPEWREDHTSTLLLDGTVLVVCGYPQVNKAGAAIYDPLGNVWSHAGTMSSMRDRGTATLLPSGEVLVTGGYDGATTVATADLYGSPGGSSSSTSAGSSASASSSAGVGGSSSASSSAGVGGSASASTSAGVGGSMGVGSSASASASVGVGGSASASSSAGVGGSASASTSAGVGGSGGGSNVGAESSSCSQAAGGSAGVNPAWLLLGLALLRRRKSR